MIARWKTPTDLELRGHAHPDADTWILAFAWPKNPLPMNGGRGNNWRAKAGQEARIRATVQAHAMAARIPELGRCRALVTWWVADRRVRDVDNLGRLEKRMFDGLVRADVVEDDKPALMVKARGEIQHIGSHAAPLLNNPGFTLTVTRLETEERA